MFPHQNSRHLFKIKIQKANKLSSSTLSTKDWLFTLKSFILSETKSSISPLEVNTMIQTGAYDKANIHVLGNDS